MKINYAFLLMFIVLLNQCTKPEKNSKKLENDPDSLMQDKKLILFVGTYTDGIGASKSKGIYVFELNFNSKTYRLLSENMVSNPSYLVIHPNKKYLYCVNENSIGKVSSFLIDSGYTLNKINEVSSKGSFPCHISISNNQQYVFIANYGSGNFTVFKIESNGALSNPLFVFQNDGKGVNESRQDGPHAHMIKQITIFNQNNAVFATDLGLDFLNIFTLDTLNNKINLVDKLYSAPGSGPRHFTVHPKNPWLYVLHELNGTIEFSVILSQGFDKKQIISTKDINDSRYPGSADIHITPNGKYLYATNRGSINNIVIFEIDQTSGILKKKSSINSGGNTPRNFIIDSSGKYLLVANQGSNNICIFQIEETGTLKETEIKIKVPSPVCIKLL